MLEKINNYFFPLIYLFIYLKKITVYRLLTHLELTQLNSRVQR